LKLLLLFSFLLLGHLLIFIICCTLLLACDLLLLLRFLDSLQILKHFLLLFRIEVKKDIRKIVAQVEKRLLALKLCFGQLVGIDVISLELR
jgi:hypothetical protein